jgi:hypothetical protein
VTTFPLNIITGLINGITGPDPMGAKIAMWIAWHRHLFVMPWAWRSIALSIVLIVMERGAQAITETASRQVANFAHGA